MKKVLGLIFNPWVIGLLGFLALAFVIWFFGPLLAFGENYFLEPENRRYILIGIVAAIMIARALWKKFRANKADSGIVEGIVEAGAPATPDQGEEEIELLKGRFEDAVKLLKKSGDKKTSLYEMPWYIIIGPPGSGKTTALVNSGLEFPLADQFGKEALQGVGGTRNCDWWFTNEAVMLDTAGRYTTQDSDASVDSTAWLGFLDLLKKHRKRRPINGVFVAVSVQDLLTLNESDRAAHAAAIKNRIQELYEHFGIRFPIYVMLTKADLVSGFMEFFDDLGQGEREQVWGFTLPLLDKSTDFDFEAAFSSEYDALVNRLNDRLPQRLRQEQDLQRRAAMFGFPRQVVALKPALEDFLMKVFKPSRYDPPYMWRGLYFTSGTQEGTPIDRLLGSLARTFGLERQDVATHGASGSQGRSYFIGDLLQEVAFKESELAGTNRRLEIQRAWLQRASYAAVVLFAIGALVAWSVSFIGNRTLIKEAAAQATELQEMAANLDTRQSHPLDVLPLLDKAASMPGGFLDRERGTPFLQSFGLYQGKRLGYASEKAYVRLLGNEFLPRVILDQETQMRRGWDNSEMLFNALKSYLMLDNDEQFDPLFVRTVWKVLWEDDLPSDTTQEEVEALNWHALSLVNNMPNSLPEQLDDSLIDRARRDARRITPAQRVYARVRQRAANEELNDFTVAKAAGRDAALVFRRKSGKPLTDGIDGFYRYEAFSTLFDKINKEESNDLGSDAWVLGEEVLPDTDAAELESEVLGLYLGDYESKYAELVADLSLQPPSGRKEAVQMLRILSHEKQSPLRKLVEAIIEEITLDREEEDGVASKLSRAAQKARDIEKSVEQKIRATTGKSTPRIRGVRLTPRQRQMAALGSKKMGKLKEMTSTEDGDSLFDEVLELLSELYILMDDIDQSSDPVEAAAKAAPKLESVTAELNRKTKGQDPLVAGVVKDMVSGVKGVMSGSTRVHLNNLWSGEGLDRCRDTIQGRYPFSRGSRNEIKMDDFGDFFGNGGDMDEFFKTHLEEYVDTSRSPWSWKAEMRGASASALAQFERAERIRNSYFRRSGSSPQVRFSLTPVDMDRTISSFVLMLGDTRITYDHGPTRPVQFSWPGADSSDVHIELSPQSPSPAAADENGDWGWFRLLQRADMRPSPDRGGSYEVTFQLGSRAATFELNPKSSYNPFEISDLSSFSCPERL